MWNQFILDLFINIIQNINWIITWTLRYHIQHLQVDSEYIFNNLQECHEYKSKK